MKSLGWGALLVLGLLVAPFVTSEPQLRMATEIVLLSVLAIAFNLQFGYAGMLNFGINSAFGIGAYGSALFALSFGSAGAIASILAGLVAAIVFGFVTGPISVRLRGGYFALLTLGLSQFLYTLAMRLRELTHGDDGLFLRDDLSLLPGGIGGSTGSGLVCYALAATLSVLLLAGLWIVLRSPFGRTIILLRENEERAEALGLHVFGARLAVYVLSSALAGTAGGCYAIFQKVVTPTLFGIQFGGDVTIMTLIGGTGAFLGPVLGVGIYEVLQDWLGQITHRWQFFMGLLLVLVVLFAPRGAAGFFVRASGEPVLRSLLRSRRPTVAGKARRPA